MNRIARLLTVLSMTLIISGCATKETAIVVDKPVVPVYVPAEVRSPDILLFVEKDSTGNTLYSFDENNFIKLKKFLLDITRNNEFTREIVCYYNEDICIKIENKDSDKEK